MPYETRATIERDRDELREALEGILDRVTDALGVDVADDELDEDADDEVEQFEADED